MVTMEQAAEQGRKPLPRTQAAMADLIVDGRVRYHPSTATWFTGPSDVAVKSNGRALREMRMAGLIELDEGGTPDEGGALPVVLTEAGRARHRPRQ